VVGIGTRVMSAVATAGIVAGVASAAGAATAPVARPDLYRLRAGQELVVPVVEGVLANDDGAGRAVRAGGPAHGTLSLRAAGSFRYRPDAGFSGWDSFTYRAGRGSVSSAPARVRLLVNGRPVAHADSYEVVPGGVLRVDPPGVVVNDVDATTTYLHAQLVRGPSHGTATLGAYGRLRYRPAAGFSGTDTLTYRVIDSFGWWSVPATVTVWVSPANRPPVGEPDEYTTGEDIPLEMSAPGVLDNDSDPDGDELVAELLSWPQHGALDLRSDGSFVFEPGIDQDFDVSFTYRVGDGRSWSDPVTVSIDVVAANDPPTAQDDYYGATAGAVLQIGSPGVLENDFDPVENDGLKASLLGQPATGTVTLDENGGFTFVADPGEYRWDAFSYQACDPGGCAQAQVTLEVFEAN
jgi:hypothetical protein